MTGWVWAAVALIVAGKVLMLFSVGWAMARDMRPWPGPANHRRPLQVMAAGAVLAIGGFVWAVILT